MGEAQERQFREWITAFGRRLGDEYITRFRREARDISAMKLPQERSRALLETTAAAHVKRFESELTRVSKVAAGIVD